MQKARVKAVRQNRQTIIQFSKQDLVSIPNFFFDQIMGAGGPSYLSTLISYYGRHKKG